MDVEGVRRSSLPQLIAPSSQPAKRPSESATEMVQVVLPNDANPLGFILGGTVMHLIDIAAAIACHRHTRSLLVTAAVDGLQFLHPIKVGDLIILKARVTAAWSTSLEVGGRSLFGGDPDRPAQADEPRLSHVRHGGQRRESRDRPAADSRDRRRKAQSRGSRSEACRTVEGEEARWKPERLSSPRGRRRCDRDRSTPDTCSGSGDRRSLRAGTRGACSAPSG